MKAQAEKSLQRRRLGAVLGGRVAAAPARFFRLIAVAGLVALSLARWGSSELIASTARADEPASATPAASTLPPEELERQAESIARSIMSPFCPGRTVSACPVAGPWRDDIRRWVIEGVDAIEIKRRLAERVPEHNLGGVPKNRLGWVLPVGLGIAAVALLTFLLRRLVGAGASGPAGRGASGTKSKAAGVEQAADAPPGNATAGKANAAAASPKADGEDYDARLQEELETLER